MFYLVFGALLRAARLWSWRLRFAVTKPPVRGQRYRLFRRRAHRRFCVVVVVVVPIVVELFVIVDFGFTHRPLAAVRLSAVLAGAATLAVTVRVDVIVSRVHVSSACNTRRNLYSTLNRKNIIITHGQQLMLNFNE